MTKIREIGEAIETTEALESVKGLCLISGVEDSVNKQVNKVSG
jgi:hypothetical protein